MNIRYPLYEGVYRILTFIFGLSGVLYDGVVSWSFFENIAVFTAVDDDIVVHRLTVETA